MRTTPLGLRALDADNTVTKLDPLTETILRSCVSKKLTIYELVMVIRTTLPGYRTNNAVRYIAEAVVRLQDHGLLSKDESLQ